MLVIFRIAVPEFCTWTVLTADCTPVVTLPKSSVDGVKVTAEVAASPVPVRAEVTEVGPPVKDWVSVADLAPVVVGVKVADNWQVALGASVEPQDVPKKK